MDAVDKEGQGPWRGLSEGLQLLASIGRIHIVAIAMLACFTFGWVFTGSYPWALAAICGLDWFLVNLLNRVVDVREDRANAVLGADFAHRHRRAISWLGFGTLALSFLAVALLEPVLLPLRAAYHLLGFAYNWPLLPGVGRIKPLYFWKNSASATGFMITVFGYPLAVAWRSGAGLTADITWATVLVSGLFFFLFELSYEVIYDLRDAPGDAREGVRTYPVVHGERVAVRIVDGLLASSFAILVAGYVAQLVPWRLAVMAAAPLLQLVYYKRALARGIRSADCVAITWVGAGLLAIYHVWELLGLPGAGS